MKQKTISVPGATIYYEVRGHGPVLILIPGGPTDADTLAPLAQCLEDRFTVVTYDPRGNSRSVFDDEPVEQSMDVHGNDLAVLIAQFGEEPAFVFGNSGGAQIGLNLCARYPQLVKRLIAHEPPCIRMLNEDEAQKTLSTMDQVVETYHSQGFGPAMALFGETAGMTPPARSQTTNEVPRPTEPRASNPRMKANLDYFLAHGVRPIANYRPNIEALRRSDVVVGVGAESEGQLANKTGRALAQALGQSAQVFPGDHSGWIRQPESFAETLVELLRA